MTDRTISSQTRRRRMRVALGLSLALNLLFVGAFAGAAYRHAGGPGAREDDRVRAHSYAAPYVMALPRQERRALGRALRKERDESGHGKAAWRANQTALVAALRAEPFDRDAVAGLLRQQRDAMMATQSNGQAAWLAVVGDMTTNQRAAVADRLEKILRDGGKRREKRERRD